MMNKKGDIATAILPVLALVLSLLCLFIFVTFSNSYTGNSAQLQELSSKNTFSSDYILSLSKILAEKSITCNDPKLCPSSDLKERYILFASTESLIPEGTENFFGKISRGEFTFSKNENINTLNIPQLTLLTQSGSNKLTRTLNICMQFNDKGEYLKNC